MLRRISLFFLLLSLAIIFSQSKVLAADSISDSALGPINLTVSPISLQIVTDPGISSDTPIRIRNNSNFPEHLQISMMTFVSDSTGEHPKLRDFNTNDLHKDWLVPSEDQFVIQPGEWKSLSVKFSPPSDAALSYNYALIIGRGAVKPIGGATVVNGSAAIMVVTTVNSPRAVRELSLANFRIPHLFSEFLPVEFDTMIKNTGNVISVPTGNIFIDGQGKKDLAVLSINPNGLTILPNTTRSFKISWVDGFPVYVDEKGTTKLSWDFNVVSHLRLGRYTAHLLLVYDNGTHDVPIESSFSFWVIPVRLIIAVIAIPVLPAVLVFLFMRWRFQRALRKASLKIGESV